MSFLHKSSLECAKSELDLLHTPETQAMILSGRWVDYHPISVLTGDGPVEFKVSGSAEEYNDISQTYLYLESKVLTDSGEALTEDTKKKIAPANLFMHSLFSQVDVLLNDTLVTSSVNTYAYRSMIETLLNYGEDSKNTHLTASLFYKDTPGQMNSLNENVGWVARNSLMGKSKTIDMFGRIHADIFHQDRYLLNNVEMRVKLIRSRPGFCLIGDGTVNGKVDITKAVLFVRKVRINPDVMLAHASVLEKSTAKYPIRRVETKAITLPAQIFNIVQDNISNGPLPNRVVLGLVSSEAYNGALTKNPYNFHHFNLKKVAFSVDGEDVPYKALDLDFENNNFIMGYYSLFTGTDKSVYDSGNFIKREEYPKGYTLFAFDLTGDLCNGDHFNLVRSGNLRLNLQFASALQEPVTCIIYLEYQNLIEINKNRQIIFDYNV